MTKNKNAFTLLVMCVVVTILGIIMSSVLSFYKINNIKIRTLQNQIKLQEIELAIKKYVIENRHFPCPAPLNCSNSTCKNSKYQIGIENCDEDENAIFSSKNNNNQKILYGNIPAITLGLPTNYMINSYGNKIVYIIPQSLTETKNFSSFINNIINKTKAEYVKDGIIYLIINFNKNANGAYSYKNTKVNYFTGKKNMPIKDFEINISDKNTNMFFYKNYDNFDLDNFEEYIQECEETTKTITISETSETYTFTFPKSKYGEIAFSNELCPDRISNEVKNDDYYYLSTYTNPSGSVIINKPALKCGKGGKWDSNFIYSCKSTPKCTKPTYPSKTFENTYNFPVVNMGYIKDDDDTIKIRCIYDGQIQKWYLDN